MTCHSHVLIGHESEVIAYLQERVWGCAKIRGSHGRPATRHRAWPLWGVAVLTSTCLFVWLCGFVPAGHHLHHRAHVLHRF